MIKIDENTIFEEIAKEKPTSIAINGPDGILPKIQQTATKIMKRFGIPVYVIADTSWGSCDLNSNSANVLGVDILFNIGHTINTGTLGRVKMIDAFDDISFDKVAQKAVKLLKGKIISISTDSQHLHEIKNVKQIFENGNIEVIIGGGKGQLNDGQVFGCEFYPTSETREKADVNVFLGQSNFHAAGIALSSNKPTYLLDPYFNEIREVTEFAKKLKKRATLSIYKAAEAQNFGIILGLKEGQLSKLTALKFKRELEKEGKTVELFAITEITNDRLRNLRGIDAFIQVACPRISLDNQFDKPVLSSPQAYALLKLLRKEDFENYLQIPHWL